MSKLSLEQQREICAAVKESYLDLLGDVGDYPDVLLSLIRLAHRMFLAGLASQATHSPTRLEKP